MLKERMRELFKTYDPEIQKLVADVLTIEQQYISFELKTNSKALKEIRDNIKQTIDRMVKDNEA